MFDVHFHAVARCLSFVILRLKILMIQMASFGRIAHSIILKAQYVLGSYTIWLLVEFCEGNLIKNG